MQSKQESEGPLPGEVRGWWPIPNFGYSGLAGKAAVIAADGEAVSQWCFPESARPSTAATPRCHPSAGVRG